MEELGCKRSMYTWLNNRKGLMRIMEQLDRLLGNKQWSQKFPKAQCINELVIGSDHSPLTIELEHADIRGRKRFRFEEMWLEHEECGTVIMKV